MMKKIIAVIFFLILFPAALHAQQPVTLATPLDDTNDKIQMRGKEVSGTLQSAATANGNGTVLATTGLSTAVLTVNCSSCSGGTTVNFEGSEDGSNYTAVTGHQVGTNTTATTTTTSGLTYWRMATGGFQNIRARISAYSAGTVTITGHAVGVTTPTNTVNANIVSNTATNQSSNVAQFGGSNVVTGTGAGGAGIPRVTISNDSSLAANQSTNLAQVAGTTTAVNNGTASAGAQRVVIASDNTAFSVNATLSAETTKVIGVVRNVGNAGATLDSAPDATAPTNVLNVAGRFVTTPATLTTGQAGSLQLTAAQNLKSDVTTMNGVAVTMGNGASGTGVQRVTIANDSTGVVGVLPVTSGGLSISRTVSAASTNATNVKASAGQVYQVIASNVNAAARYIHLYNTSGTPTCNTSIIATFIVPGNTAGAGTNITLAPGAAFGTGIAFCITTGLDGTGSVAANDLVLNVFYK